MTRALSGAAVTGAYWTSTSDEATLKKLVASHGAVLTGVAAGGAFSQYQGGIFSGCSSTAEPDHAVVVVGYGNQDGVDFWLVKNSWGSSWGENGYIRVKRGVKMCGIGGGVVTVSCATTNNNPTTTAAPTTTTDETTESITTGSASSCTDLSWCKFLPKFVCRFQDLTWECPQRCNRCP